MVQLVKTTQKWITDTQEEADVLANELKRLAGKNCISYSTIKQKQNGKDSWTVIEFTEEY